MRLSRFLPMAGALLAGGVRLAAAAETVAVMPFTNLSGVERAPAEIGAGFVRRVVAKGYAAAPAADVEAFLAAERVRYLDSLSRELREKLLARLSASAVVFGTVYSLAEGDNAIVGVSARMLRADGTVTWAGVAGLATEDTEGAFGLHRTNSTAVLGEKAVERLVRDFPAPGAGPVKLASARAKPLAAARPVTFRSNALETGSGRRICLLPLENRSTARLAPRAVSELLAQRLGASGTFEIVEPAEFRSAMVAAGVRGLKSGDPVELAKLSKILGTSLFLKGTIYVFRDGSTRNASITPELELDLTLVDATAGRILWTSRIQRQGRDYEGFLQRGAITSIVALTDQAAAEIVRAAESTKGRGRRLATPVVTAAHKIYDGTAAATITSCTLTGVLAGDAAGLSCTAAAASFSDANAGTGKTVTVSGVVLSGSASGNYTLSSPTVTTLANINRKPVTPSVTASDKTFDGDAAAPIASCALSGVLPGDSEQVKCLAGTASFSDSNAGARKTVTAIGIALSGGASGNYALSSTTATAVADIHRKPVTAGVTVAPKTYDGTSSASITSCTLSGVLGDDSGKVGCSVASAAFADAAAGTAKPALAIGIGLFGPLSGNYAMAATTATAAADVTPRPVTASIAASNKVYDGTAAASITGCALTGVVASDSGAVGCLASGGAFSDRNAGAGKAVTATVALEGAAAGNYGLTSIAAAGNASISPRPLTVSGVTALGKIYDGTAAASLVATSAALVNAVSGDDVSLDARGAAGAFAGRNAGRGLAVTVAGLAIVGKDSGNYTLAQPAARGDIAPRAVDPRVTAADKVYDGTTAATLSSQGLVGVLAPDANDVGLTVSNASFDSKSVGSGKTVAATGLGLSGGAAGNYALSSPRAAAAAGITARHVTASFTASDREYDGSIEAAVRTRSLDGTVAGDDVGLAGGRATFGDRSAGAGKTVVLTGASLSGPDAGNYALDSVAAATAGIEPRHVTGRFTAKDKEYDGNTSATVLTRSLRRTVAGDSVSLEGGTAAFSDENVGTGKTVVLTGATLSGPDAGNYVLDSVAPTTASIRARRRAAGFTTTDEETEGDKWTTFSRTGARPASHGVL